MNNIDRTILTNSLMIYEYLSIYGIDRHNTKEDIILISMIKDLLYNNCYFDLVDECTMWKIKKILSNILNRNPQLRHCRINLDDYKNLGGKQNITTYQIIKIQEIG